MQGAMTTQLETAKNDSSQQPQIRYIGLVLFSVTFEMSGAST